MRRQGESWTVMRITFYRLSEQIKRSGQLVLLIGEALWESAQVQIIGGQIGSRTASGTRRFGGLQGRFDDAGDARRHLPVGQRHLRPNRRNGRPKGGFRSVHRSAAR